MPFDLARYTNLRKQGMSPSLAKQLAKVSMPVDGGSVEEEDDE